MFVAEGRFRVSDDSTTRCLLFPEIFGKPVVLQVDQRNGSSDGVAVLLKAADVRYGLIRALAGRLQDRRQAGKMITPCVSCCRSACSRLPAAIRTTTTQPACLPAPSTRSCSTTILSRSVLASYMRGWRSDCGFCETLYVLIQLTRWVRLRLRAAMWRQWKTPRRRRAVLLALGFVQDCPATRPAADSARGTWPEPKPSQWGFPMLTSNRFDFRHYSTAASATDSDRRVWARTHRSVAGVGG